MTMKKKELLEQENSVPETTALDSTAIPADDMVIPDAAPTDSEDLNTLLAAMDSPDDAGDLPELAENEVFGDDPVDRDEDAAEPPLPRMLMPSGMMRQRLTTPKNFLQIRKGPMMRPTPPRMLKLPKRRLSKSPDALPVERKQRPPLPKLPRWKFLFRRRTLRILRWMNRRPRIRLRRVKLFRRTPPFPWRSTLPKLPLPRHLPAVKMLSRVVMRLF